MLKYVLQHRLLGRYLPWLWNPEPKTLKISYFWVRSTYLTSESGYLGSNMTWLCNFWHFCDKFSCKSSPNLTRHLGHFGKHHFSRSNCCGYFLANFLGKNWLLFIPPFSHTCCKESDWICNSQTEDLAKAFIELFFETWTCVKSLVFAMASFFVNKWSNLGLSFALLIFFCCKR